MRVRSWPQRLTVTVTADDIAAGRPLDCHRCPVARAAGRALGIGRGGRYVLTAGMARIDVLNTDDPYVPEPVAGWTTPPRVREFMEVFDAELCGGPVTPFTFTAERAA